MDERIGDIATHARGRSVTALIEQNARRGRQRNTLFRAWRVAMKAERVEFLNVLQRLAFFAEREDAVKGNP